MTSGPTIPGAGANGRATTSDLPDLGGSTDVDLALDLLNRAVHDTGHTLDSLEAAMGKGRAYIGRVLAGDKPLSYAFICALPDDVEQRFEQLRGEQLGLIVVAPAVDQQDALQQFVTGLVGLVVGHRLPARADRMAKADVAAPAQRKAGAR